MKHTHNIQLIVKHDGILKANGGLHKVNALKWLIAKETKIAPSATIIATKRILTKCEQAFGTIYTKPSYANKAVNITVRSMGYTVMTPTMAIQLVIDELLANNTAGVVATKKAVLRGATIFGGALYTHTKAHYKMHQAIIKAGMQPNTVLVYNKNGDVFAKYKG